MGEDLLRLRVPCDSHAPAAVRAALVDLDGLGWMLGDAMLVASELVTNAVLHSGCSPEDQLDVSVAMEGSLWITVTDPGLSGKSAEVPQRDIGFGGLGLRVVEQLVKSWGTERRLEGHAVWAQLCARSPEGGWSRAASWREGALPPVTYADDGSSPSMCAN